MDTINLLPEDTKKNLATDQKFRVIIFSMIWITSTILVACLILYATSIYLQIQQQSLNEELSALKNNPSWSKIATIEGNIRQFNQRAQSVLKLQSQIKNWAPFFATITNATPQGITLNGITLNATNDLAVVNGHAQTRDEALAFKDALGAISEVSQVNAPLENFLQETDITFSFTLSLK